MERKLGRPLTKNQILGLQVVNADGYYIGKVKDVVLCIGEMDQALILEKSDGEEEIHRWSEVVSVGDVVLLRMAISQPPSHASPPEPYTSTSVASTAIVAPAHCRGCNAPLEPGARFCGSCGKQVH